ncbi:hypothetical protein ANANG_G00260050 [Anguilla anguilla]|uniref:FHA domain-containing protein n=1 Tax=Anguilla anguilla TaxID=7936 RepID=A0A9D3RNQ5_ANGAN|nr:hypothetical protein ANANG_G00260050 [Anguilla anguilla]
MGGGHSRRERGPLHVELGEGPVARGGGPVAQKGGPVAREGGPVAPALLRTGWQRGRRPSGRKPRERRARGARGRGPTRRAAGASRRRARSPSRRRRRRSATAPPGPPPPPPPPSSASEPEDQGGSEEAWPPCVRVTVVRSPVLQTGTLYIITADTPATIGREKDMAHAIRIPEVGVSKFHAEVYFDQELQCYVLVDQGSQNGTVINGNRILQPKAKSEPCTLTHGDEIKMGDTVLSFHIHSGNDTCDGCEPGQVIAHLTRHKREEPAGQGISREDKELQRQKELKQMKVKYGLKNSEYEGAKVLKSSKYKDRAEKRRQVVGSEGPFTGTTRRPPCT